MSNGPSGMQIVISNLCRSSFPGEAFRTKAGAFPVPIFGAISTKSYKILSNHCW